MRFSLIICILCLSVSPSLAEDENLHLSIARSSKATITKHDKKFGPTRSYKQSLPEPESLIEHVVVVVKDFAYIAGHSMESQTNQRTDTHLELRLIGSNPKIDFVSVNFWPDNQSLTQPTYSKEHKYIAMYFPYSRQAAIDTILRKSKTVLVQYREYSNGHRWADIHTDLTSVGGQAKD